jgi:adenylosuccinate synthase
MSENIVVLGCQWGDEGKGKVVDRLAESVELVIRFQGGANAGHTVRIGDETFILHLLPSGILREGIECLLGGGVVVDPWILCEEFDTLAARSIDAESRVKISGSAHFVMPYHKRLEELREAELNRKSIGTTGRGIGPAYEDKMARLGVRASDLMRPDDSLRRLIIDKTLRANRLLAERHEAAPLASEALADEMIAFAHRLRPRIVSSFAFLEPVRSGKKRTLLEGAQGTLLDVDHGTFPFVTSSSCAIGSAMTGTGLSPKHLGKIVGVFKAYCTRVGNGPFPSELHGDEAEDLRAKGSEFGATTGRPRRCGWFDVVAARYAAEINGLDEIVMTKLDVLSGMEKIRIATAYDFDGEKRELFTNWTEELSRAQATYEEVDGWDADISGMTSFDDFPKEAQAYVRRIEELVGVPIRVVCTGPDRDHWVDRSAG